MKALLPVYWLALAAGALLAAYGMVQLPWTGPHLWAPGAFSRFAGLLAVLTLAIATLARFARLGATGAALVTMSAMLFLLGAWPSLVVLAALALACIVVGARLRQLWQDASDREDDALVDLLVGAGAYGTLVGLLAHLPIAHKLSYTVLIAAPIVLDRRALVARLAAWRLHLRAQGRTPLVAWLGCGLAGVYAIVALMPELGWDALAMHLYIPGYLSTHRSWHFDPAQMSFAVMPMLVDWLYAIPYMFDGERGARLFNAAFVAVLAAIVWRLAAIAGATRGWAWFAVALLLATPCIFQVGSSLFIETTWTALVAGSVLSILRTQAGSLPPRAWVTAGALAGFAAAAKAVTLPMLPVIALLALVRCRPLPLRESWRVTALALLVFLLAACVPYVTAWLATGNPVWPFFGGIFGGLPFGAWENGPQHFDEPLTWRLLYDVTFESSRFVEGRAGTPGFQWLALLPAALFALLAARARRGLELLLAGALMLVLVFLFTAYLRYVIPAFALLVAALGAAGAGIATLGRWDGRAYAAVGMAIIAANLAHLNAAAPYQAFPLSTVASAQRHARFIDAVLPIRSAIALADRLPRQNERIALFGMPAIAAAPDVQYALHNWYTARFWMQALAADTPEALARTLLDWRVRHVIVQPSLVDGKTLALLGAATRPHLDFAGIGIREVDLDRLAKTELLRDAGLASGQGWLLQGGAAYEPADRLIAVPTGASAAQVVAVEPDAPYRSMLRIRCPVPLEPHVQVSWLDAAHRPISLWSRRFACLDAWTEQVDVVHAPAAARFASIQVGPFPVPVQLGGASFKSLSR